MLAILLKSSACLAVFMLFYKLFLEQTSAHKFKRFYLLAILFISAAIPFITFTNYIESPTSLNTLEPIIEFETLSNSSTLVQPLSTNYLPVILWSIYGIGVILFSFRFINNLSKLLKRIKKYPKQKLNDLNLILLNDAIPPHTFFNYIFLNKNDFDNNKIDNTVLLHERTHAIQKHTIDILLIEIIQIIFWFNPLLVLLKKFIKLNHEFLADQSVLNTGIEIFDYQNMLLTFSSNTQYSTLANPINYSSLKKRFKLMKIHTSKSKLLMRILLLLPLFIFSVYSFSQQNVIVNTSHTINKNKIFINDIQLVIKNKDNLVLNGKDVTIENLKAKVDNLNPDLTDKQKQDFLFAYLLMDNENLYPYAKEIVNFLSKNCGIPQSQIVIVNDYTNLNLYKSPFNGKTIAEAQSILDNQTIDLTPREEADSPWKVTVGVSAADLTLNNELYEKKRLGPTKVEEYNLLVDLFNNLPKDSKIVRLKDFQTLHELYNQIPESQKSEVKQFPNFLSSPKSNEQFIIDIINNGATCYLNNERVTSKKAISIINSTSKLNVSTKNDKGKTIVNIYTEDFKE